MDLDNINSVPSENPEKTPKKKRGVPVWVLLCAVFLAALVTFQATFVILTGSYNTALNKYSGEKSTVSKDLGKTYSIMDEIAGLFEKNYIYDLNYAELSEEMIRSYVYDYGDKYGEYYTAEERMEEINDSNGNSAGIGILVAALYDKETRHIDEGLYVSHVMKDGPASNAGIVDGDIIVAIDGKSLKGMTYSESIDACRGETGTNIDVTIKRNGEVMTVTVTRGSYTNETVLFSEKETNGHKIGYIRITEFYTITVEQFKNAVKSLLDDGCEGLVFDVRGNPGGYLTSIVNVLDYLLPKGPIVKLTYANGIENTLTSDDNCVSGVPMAVIVNGSTASAAELFTSAIKDYKYATIVGTTTYGKGCGQNIYPLSNGGYVKITSFLYSPPFSGNYDGVGIEPDIVVELEGEAASKNLFLLSEEEDTQLSAALNDVLSKLK